jgi:hypothetical protein
VPSAVPTVADVPVPLPDPLPTRPVTGHGKAKPPTLPTDPTGSG